MSSIIEHNADDLFNDFLENIENEIGEPLYPGDERRMFAEALIATLVSFLATADDRVKQSRLQYARGEVLDSIGEMFGVDRNDGKKAVTAIKFNVSSPVSVDISIPAGTTVTNDYEHYFVTTKNVSILSGDTEVTVEAEASEVGSSYNNIGVGEIDTLTTSIAYIDNIENTIITSGGTDVENDDDYRDRIQLSMDRFASGTENYYKYIVFSADNSIQDIYMSNEEFDYTIDGITSNSYYISAENAVIENNNVKCVIKSATGTTYNYIAPVIGDKVLCITKNSLWGDSYSVTFNKTVPGTIVMYLLCKDGVLPNQSLVESIEKVCNSNSVRCFNDKIIVRPAVPYEYKINVQCYINPSDDIENIKTEIKKSVEDYKKWQGSKIGRNINKDKLQMYVMQAGAYKVSVGLPSHKVIKDYNVAVCTDIKIGFVVEEES